MPREAELSLILKPAGLRVLIAGAGNVAAQKLKALPRGLAVHVVAPSLRKGLKRQGVRISRRKARLSDVDVADLIFAATDKPAVNAALCERALAKGKLASCADAPELGNFTLPAVAKAGPLRVSVSTSGASPAVAKALRAWLEQRLRGSKLLKLTMALGKRLAWLKSHPAEKEKMLAPLRKLSSFSKLLR